MRENFRRNMTAVQTALADLADTAGAVMEQATRALLDADPTAVEQTEELNAGLRASLATLENQTYELLALQAPVASDLRLLVTVVRLGSDIARMGSLAGHIAETAALRSPDPVIPESLRPTFRQMGVVAARMASDAATALRSRETADAGRLAEEDDIIDQLRLELFHRIAEGWTFGPAAAADVALLGRYYERFADHAVALAESVIYLVTGVHTDQSG